MFVMAEFQFQIGAIKREIMAELNFNSDGFNSKLVRLKEKPKRGSRKLSVSFQFQIGAIKSNVKTVNNKRQQRFNSKLVRLKGTS